MAAARFQLPCSMVSMRSRSPMVCGAPAPPGRPCLVGNRRRGTTLNSSVVKRSICARVTAGISWLSAADGERGFVRPDVRTAGFRVPAEADELAGATEDFEGMKLARLNEIAGAIDADVLRRQADAHQRCHAENVVGQLVGKGGVLRINDVGIDDNNFGLHGEAAAIVIDGLIFGDGGGKIGVIPLK